MRQFTTKHTVYNFEELSNEAQEKALNTLHEINLDYEWYTFTIEDKEAALEAQGVDNIDIQFSGFWSQGDGASITFNINDLKKFMKHHKISNKFKLVYNNEDVIVANVTRASYPHYVHENMVRGDVSIHGYIDDDMTSEKINKLEEQVNAFEEWLTEYIRDESQELYKALEAEYSYLTSEEGIKETIEVNQYEFYEDGTLA